MPVRFSVLSKNFTREFEKFLNIKRASQGNIESVVNNILNDIRVRGNAALFEYTSQFDKHELTSSNVRISSEEMEGSLVECKQEQLDALRIAKKRIRDFHKKQLPSNIDYQDDEGYECLQKGEKPRPPCRNFPQ